MRSRPGCDGANIWYEAISVKPANQLGDKRSAEKLDIERVWWQLQKIPFHLFVMTEQNKIQSKNIQWFTSPYRQGRRFPDAIMYRAAALISQGTVLVEDLCDAFIRELGVEHGDALLLLKSLMATKLVNVDLNKPIAETSVLEIISISHHGLEQRHAC